MPKISRVGKENEISHLGTQKDKGAPESYRKTLLNI